MSKQRQKGTEFENEMVDLLTENGFLAKRKAQAGTKDQGDLEIVGAQLLIECKKQNTICLPAWIRKAEKKNPNWVIFYADDRRLTDSVGTVAVLPAELFAGLLSWAQEAIDGRDYVSGPGAVMQGAKEPE